MRPESAETAAKPIEPTTPLMKQYEQLKAAHPKEILLFRLGDFYEMFGEDAKTAAPVLEVALTQRQGTPMCGMPFHSAERYIARLLKKGHRVAIAEQMEDPEAAKGIVRRDIVRVISAGTVIEENLLQEKSNNYLLALAWGAPAGDGARLPVGLAALDVSTGQWTVTQLETGADFARLTNEICRINPAEILLLDGYTLPHALNEFLTHRIHPAELEAADLSAFIGKGQPWEKQPCVALAARMVLGYVRKMNPSFLTHLQEPQWVASEETMALDKETIENLELLQNSYDRTSDKTLLQFLDRTQTPMGGRLLKHWIVRPLLRKERILERLSAVDHFVQQPALRRGLRDALKGSSDLERLCIRICSGAANPRDVIGLRNSLEKIRNLKSILNQAAQDPRAMNAPLPPRTDELQRSLDECPDLAELVLAAIADEPPVQLDQGGVIRAGYDALLDEKRKAAQEGKGWLQELERRERETTGISTLKVGYTSVFGYYFEVTKSHLSKVPATWHRKQTLVNNERYINQELKDLESKILGAEEQALRIERQIFNQVVAAIKEKISRIQKTSCALAELDALLALAETAELKNLVRPQIADSDELAILDGWHPVVKEFLPSGAFVPNDTILSGRERIMILTGPNMAGKSTYLRQTAIAALMAQIGSFVPARAATIGIVDRIFTRIGSGDRLAQGESTFMVEMRETARILQQASNRSLIILDEVGRGTSTYDGISIAWAVIEYLASELRSKVLFATHYFELTQLAGQIEGVKNSSVQAKEWKDSVLFLHKIVDGPADRSYGIHVAQLAGLPAPVVQRSRKILDALEQEHTSLLKSRKSKQQEFLFEE